MPKTPSVVETLFFLVGWSSSFEVIDGVFIWGPLSVVLSFMTNASATSFVAWILWFALTGSLIHADNNKLMQEQLQNKENLG